MSKNLALATRIKELRNSGSLTQHQLSHQSGLSRSYISRLEMGDIALPSRDKLRSLAAALRVPTEDLLQAAGFLDVATERSQLPDIKTYLRYRYQIDDCGVLRAIEAMVRTLQNYEATN